MHAASRVMPNHYSGDQPSPRYQELMSAYRQMHEEGAPEQGIGPEAMFPGQSLAEHAGALWAISRRFQLQTLLDYGCGKAMFYQPVHDIQAPDGRRVTCLQEMLGVDATLYDPGYRRYSEKPAGTFDLVVCTDVLEHCDEADLPWIVDELFGFARTCLFANVACYPARKSLPNGENAHCTVRAADWWRTFFSGIAAGHPAIHWQVVCTVFEDGVRRNVSFGSPSLA